MQKKAKTLRSFEKNAKEGKNVAFFWKERMPNPCFFPNTPNICLNWFSLLIKRCVRVCISIFLSSFFLFFPFSSFFLSLFSIPSYNFLPVFFPYSFFSFIILSFLNLPFFFFPFFFLDFTNYSTFTKIHLISLVDGMNYPVPRIHLDSLVDGINYLYSPKNLFSFFGRRNELLYGPKD